MRLFVGLDIDLEIRRRISDFLQEMRPYAPDVKWVSPESLHVTLKFIGEQPRDGAEAIQRGLAGIHGAPFGITFRNCGFFPSGGRSARVFWIGVDGDEPLRALARNVDEVVSHFGLESEKDYTPHLTLARARPEPKGKDRSPFFDRRGAGAQFVALQAELAKAPAPEFGTMAAREFFLYESQLSPKGAQYTKIARFALE
jgi:2'-5' RNA ligase